MPPNYLLYARSIAVWVKNARRESLAGATVVCLVAARTVTAWWHQTIKRAQEIRRLRCRLTFVGASFPASFPSALVIFNPRDKTVAHSRVFGWDWRAAEEVRQVLDLQHGRPLPAFLR